MVAVAALLPLAVMALPDGPTFVNAAFSERGHLVPVSEWKYWLVYIFPLTRLLEALCGVVVCLLVLRGRWMRSVLLPVGLLVLALVVEELWVSTSTMHSRYATGLDRAGSRPTSLPGRRIRGLGGRGRRGLR
jgi:peptidoglycan/LPS O-acetylase OafA/YrhL